MVRGFTINSGILMKYEIKDNEIIMHYSSGKDISIPFEDDSEKDFYINILDKELESNQYLREEVDELSKNLKEANEEYQSALKKNSIIAHFLTGAEVVMGGAAAILFFTNLASPDKDRAISLVVTSVSYAVTAAINGVFQRKAMVNANKKKWAADSIQYKIEDLEEEDRFRKTSYMKPKQLVILPKKQQ